MYTAVVSPDIFAEKLQSVDKPLNILKLILAVCKVTNEIYLVTLLLLLLLLLLLFYLALQPSAGHGLLVHEVS
jgi:hypothetical protein